MDSPYCGLAIFRPDWCAARRVITAADVAVYRFALVIRAATVKWYNCNTTMRFSFDLRKSRRLRANPRRGIGFEEARELFRQPYYLDRRSDWPEQFIAIGWVGGRLYSVVFEAREDELGEVLHLVTLWRSTKEEVHLYEANQ